MVLFSYTSGWTPFSSWCWISLSQHSSWNTRFKKTRNRVELISSKLSVSVCSTNWLDYCSVYPCMYCLSIHVGLLSKLMSCRLSNGSWWSCVYISWLKSLDSIILTGKCVIHLVWPFVYHTVICKVCLTASTVECYNPSYGYCVSTKKLNFTE